MPIVQQVKYISPTQGMKTLAQYNNMPLPTLNDKSNPSRRARCSD